MRLTCTKLNALVPLPKPRLLASMKCTSATHSSLTVYGLLNKPLASLRKRERERERERERVFRRESLFKRERRRGGGGGAGRTLPE